MSRALDIGQTLELLFQNYLNQFSFARAPDSVRHQYLSIWHEGADLSQLVWRLRRRRQQVTNLPNSNRRLVLYRRV
jgi:hypothetical protein